MRKSLGREEMENFRAEIRPLIRGFDLITDHVVITDPDGTVLYANQAVEEHTGFLISEIIGKNPGDLWGGQMQKEFYEDMWRRLKVDKLPFRGQVQNRKKDGTIYWQELRIFPVLNDRGEIKFFIGMEPEITVRKTEEALREQYIKELERLNDFLESKTIKMSELEEKILQFEEKMHSNP